MRARMTMALTLMLGLSLAAPAGAEKSEREKFLGHVEKVAPLYGTFDTTGRFKALCVCKTNGRAGVVETLVFSGDLYLECIVPSFDSSGHSIGSGSCSDWASVAK